MVFTEWYMCYPADGYVSQLKCMQTSPTYQHDMHKGSKLIPVCKLQPKIMKEFMLKYKYYKDIKASIK
jgi:hypothetical protein